MWRAPSPDRPSPLTFSSRCSHGFYVIGRSGTQYGALLIKSAVHKTREARLAGDWQLLGQRWMQTASPQSEKFRRRKEETSGTPGTRQKGQTGRSMTAVSGHGNHDFSWRDVADKTTANRRLHEETYQYSRRRRFAEASKTQDIEEVLLSVYLSSNQFYPSVSQCIYVSSLFLYLSIPQSLYL